MALDIFDDLMNEIFESLSDMGYSEPPPEARIFIINFLAFSMERERASLKVCAKDEPRTRHSPLEYLAAYIEDLIDNNSDVPAMLKQVISKFHTKHAV